jgi:hypothetical protein
MRAPLGLGNTRSIPGSPKLVSIAAGYHSFAYGPVVIVDATGGMNDVAGLGIVTPSAKPSPLTVRFIIVLIVISFRKLHGS